MRRGFEKESVEILTGMIREKGASGEHREWKGRLKKDAEIRDKKSVGQAFE